MGKDEAAAKQQFEFLMRQADLEAEAGQRAVSVKATVKEVMVRFLAMVRERDSEERFRLVQARLFDFCAFVGDNKPCRDLRAKDVEDWIGAKTLSPGTERTYKAIVLAMLNWAATPRSKKGGELIASNPLRGQLHLPEGGSRGAEVVWSPEVFEQVCRVANPAFANVVRILAWTGARPSTICELEARHYNARMKRLDVEDLYRGRNSRKKYVKHLRLNPQAIALVEEMAAEHAHGPLFPNAHGGAWTPETLYSYLLGLRTKYKDTKGLYWPEGLCMYGLRHTFATAFLAANPNEIEYLRVLLGHKDYKMILQHYGHLVDQHEAINRRMQNFDPFGTHPRPDV